MGSAANENYQPDLNDGYGNPQVDQSGYYDPNQFRQQQFSSPRQPQGYGNYGMNDLQLQGYPPPASSPYMQPAHQPGLSHPVNLSPGQQVYDPGAQMLQDPMVFQHRHVLRQGLLSGKDKRRSRRISINICLPWTVEVLLAVDTSYVSKKLGLIVSHTRTGPTDTATMSRCSRDLS